MASIKNVLGDIIEGVYIVEATNGTTHSKEGSAIIDEAISSFDELVAKINQNDVENKKAHFKEVRKDLEAKATKLVDDLNKLV